MVRMEIMGLNIGNGENGDNGVKYRKWGEWR